MQKWRYANQIIKALFSKMDEISNSHIEVADDSLFFLQMHKCATLHPPRTSTFFYYAYEKKK